MNLSSIIGLLQNTAILLALSLLYEFWWNYEAYRSLVVKIFAGLLLGATGLLLMVTPWTFVPGINFDTRSILLSVSGLFFGSIPTFIAMLMTATLRIIQGGGGMWMGLAVITTAGLTGIIWNRIRPGWKEKKFLYELILLGYTVHLLMLLCTFFLPRENRAETLKSIILPLLTVYPLGTVLLGSLLANQYRHWQNRLASRKLEESERRFSDLLKNTNLYSVIIDSSGKMTFCNKAFLEAIGYAEEELKDKDALHILVSHENREDYRTRLSNLFKSSDGRFSFEAEILTKSGEKITVSWNYTILNDESTGEFKGLACIGENITTRKKAEEEIIRARQKAEENDRLKTEFLSNMSHEIKTPLNAILGFTTLLTEDKLEAEEKINIRNIITGSGERLLNIINDIVDISKIEAGQLDIKKTPGKLYHLVYDIIESIKISPLYSQKQDLGFQLHFPHNLKDLNIITDHRRVQQVLSNLLTNALKYTEKGSIETGVEKITKAGKEHLMFYVKDTGSGIPDDKKELVFNRFVKLNTERYQEGAGLGLSISRGIIEMLDGDIWFESEYGKGSTFYFTIPCCETDSIIEMKNNINYPPIGLEGKKIIVAEDDINSFFYIKHLLLNTGAVIIHAHNGKDLIDILNAGSDAELILLDIAMPVMDGYEALMIIKNKWPHIKVVAQTAYAFADEREKCLAMGCDSYISKPFTGAGLMAAIHEAFRNRTSKEHPGTQI
ncbi:MAG: PAS domain S-box protein [Bacteroidales bacterium]|nr:PAS domain S-box protein [Bacteroidales bacterium]